MQFFIVTARTEPKLTFPFFILKAWGAPICQTISA